MLITTLIIIPVIKDVFDYGEGKTMTLVRTGIIMNKKNITE